MADIRRRKFDLYGWAGIPAAGEVWLVHNTDAQGTQEGREEAQMGGEKNYV